MSTELNLCPFCGGHAKLHRYRQGGATVECTKCAALSGEGPEDTVIEAWNRRAPDAPLSQEVEALRNTLSLREWEGNIAAEDTKRYRRRAEAAEAEAARLKEHLGLVRVCVNCGRTADASQVKRGDELPECINTDGLSACTFDLTAPEALEHWRNVALERQGQISRLTGERDAALAQHKQVATEGFNSGYVLACATILHLHDEPTLAADVLREAGLKWSEVAAMDLCEFDMEVLEKIRREEKDVFAPEVTTLSQKEG